MRHLNFRNRLVFLGLTCVIITINCPPAVADSTFPNITNQNLIATNNANSAAQSNATTRNSSQNSSNTASSSSDSTDTDDKNQIEKIFKDAKYKNFDTTHNN